VTLDSATSDRRDGNNINIKEIMMSEVVTPDETYPIVSPDNIDEIVAKILMDLPDEAIVKEEKYGNTYYGYSVGWTIDRMNQVVGPHQWNIRSIKSHSDKSGKTFHVTMLVAVAIGPPKAFSDTPQWACEEPWKEFTVVPVVWREAWGDCTNPGYGDAMKGAMSDGAKKALSMLGLGVKAYKGLIGGLPEDYKYQIAANTPGGSRKRGNIPTEEDTPPWE